MKDHCPTQNLLANTFTNSAFLIHSSLLAFLSEEMSLNIDINIILPVKVSGVCPIESSEDRWFYHRAATLWILENVPLEFCRLSVDGIIISVDFLGSDSCNSVLPSFIGFGGPPHPLRPHNDTKNWPKLDWPKLDWPKMDWPKLVKSGWPKRDWPKSVPSVGAPARSPKQGRVFRGCA